MKKILVILVMLIATNANAQWVQCTDYHGANVSSFLNYDSNIFVGTSLDSGIYRSTNYGTNWTRTALTTNTVTALIGYGNKILTGTFFNGVLFSSNYGNNWYPTLLNDKLIYSLTVSGNNIFAGTGLNNGVYLSTDGGLYWSQTTLNNKDVKSITTSGNIIVAGTMQYGIYISTDNGTSWTQSGLNGQSIYALTSNGNNVFAGSYNNNGVYRSTNNGLNWNQTSLNNKSIFSLAVSGNNVIAGTTLDGVYLSTNNGVSWISINQGLTGSLGMYSVLFAGNYIFASNYGNNIWRRPLSEVVSIQNISTETPSKYSLSQNYPNPFNSMCNVQFSMCNAGNVKLVVYDVQGREVQTLVNEKLQPGTYEAAFDGSMLNSGVYFYKLVTNGFTETKKMILIK